MLFMEKREIKPGVYAYVWTCKHCLAEVLTYTKVAPFCLNSKCPTNVDTSKN